MLACGRVPKSDDIDLEVHVEVGRSTEVSVNIGHRCVIRPFVHKAHLHIQYHTIQYSERFVRRRSTNRPGAPYNKSVRMCTIKQNSFKSFLECVSVSNVV